MIHLQEKEIIKIAEIAELQPSDIQRLIALDLLDEHAVFDKLIRYDYKRVSRTKAYSNEQVITFLTNKYRMSKSSIQAIIYRKNKRVYSRSISQALFHPCA